MSVSQTLYLLRHAKAVPWHPGVIDFERQLAERGVEHMRQLCSWVSDALVAPQRVLCSPSVRTRETLAPFLSAWQLTPEHVSYEAGIYEASTGRLQALAEEAFETSNRIMMVGHNPGFEHLAITVSSSADARQIMKMPTGTLAVIEFPRGWRVDQGSGRLKHWLTRKHLSQQT